MSDDARERLASNIGQAVSESSDVTRTVGTVALDEALRHPDDLIACLVESGALELNGGGYDERNRRFFRYHRTEGGEPR